MNALLAEHEITDIEDLIEQINDSSNPEETLSEPFKIKDICAANWAFRKLAALKAKNIEVYMLADEERKRISNWEASQTAINDSTIAFFESLLLDYFHRERNEDERFKLDTPYGKISTRKTDKWHYDDEKLVASLKAAGYEDYVRVTETPDKAAIKKAKDLFGISDIGTLISGDGDVIDGVRVEKIENVLITVK